MSNFIKLTGSALKQKGSVFHPDFQDIIAVINVVGFFENPTDLILHNKKVLRHRIKGKVSVIMQVDIFFYPAYNIGIRAGL